MQRGPLLQPVRSTERVLSGPPRARRLAGLSPHRLALSHGNGLRWPRRFHLSRSTGEANPPAGRVFLSAFAPQKPHSFPRGKPRFAPLPPSANTPHPISPKLSRFRAGSFVAAETAPAPRFSQSLLWGRVTPPVRVPLSLPICAKGFAVFKRAQNAGSAGTPHGLRSKQQPFLAGGVLDPSQSFFFLKPTA